MSDDPLAAAREMLAIVGEDQYNLLIDLQISGQVSDYDPQKFRYLVWNKEEGQAFGMVRKEGINLILSFVVPHLGSYNVTNGDILKKAAKSWRIFSRSMEM